MLTVRIAASKWFGSHSRSDLLPGVSVDLARLAKGLGSLVDRVRKSMISV